MKKLKKLLGILAVCSMAVVGVACSAPSNSNKDETGKNQETQKETITIAHQYGEVTVPKNPSSVAVFDFGVLDILQNLGVEVVKGVVQDTTSRPKYLSEYGKDKYINIGGLKEPNFEALYNLAPEIIFISGRQAPHYDELSKIAPVVFMEPDNKNYMGSFEKNVMRLGEIFIKEEQANKLVDALKKKVNEVSTVIKEKNATALIAMVSKGEVSVFGANSRFGMIHNTLGFKQADEQIEQAKHGQVVTFEYLAKTNPDYLFVVDKNALEETHNTAKDTLNNGLVNNIKAAKKGNIIYLDPMAWYLSPGGITSTEVMLENVIQGIK